MGGFLSSIFGGSSPGLSGAAGNAGNVAGYGISTGEGDTRSASDFLHSIIGGDPAAISKLLAPQIGAAAGRANQQIQTEGQFSNRSGGVNAANQHVVDSERGNIDNMISGLTGGAVGQLGQLGTSLIGQGLDAAGLQAKIAELQQQNAMNSILGKGISAGVGSLEGFGLNKLEDILGGKKSSGGSDGGGGGWI